jgi:hypothetical protein
MKRHDTMCGTPLGPEDVAMIRGLIRTIEKAASARDKVRKPRMRPGSSSGGSRAQRQTKGTFGVFSRLETTAASTLQDDE